MYFIETMDHSRYESNINNQSDKIKKSHNIIKKKSNKSERTLIILMYQFREILY